MMVYIPTVEDRSKRRKDHAYSALDQIANMGRFNVDPDPEFDWAAKADSIMQRAMNKWGTPPVPKFNLVGTPGKTDINFVGGGGAAGGSDAGGRLAAFIQAIAGQESGGNYGAVNPSSGALGKYQIMPSNIPSWSQAALGRTITTQEFLSSPKLQEAIARFKLTEYYRKYGVRGAASAWYSGSPDRWRDTGSQGAYPSVYNYVMQILERMGLR